MKQRAFSLIEIVLSLALMSTLVAATISWTGAASRIHLDRQHAMHNERAMETLERAIRVDLLQLDGTAVVEQPRIRADHHDLQIRTRDRGPRTVRYFFDPSSKAITRAIIGGQTDVIAYTDALSFELEIDQGTRSAILRTSVNTMGLRSRFIYLVHAEWIR